SISAAASSFSKSLYFRVFCDLIVDSDLSYWSGNRSHSAITLARGSAFAMLASYEPRPPQPTRPTAICELACEPRTDWGDTIEKGRAAAAAPERKLRRVVSGFIKRRKRRLLSPILSHCTRVPAGC